MNVFHVCDIKVDQGERIHIQTEVMPVCKENIPFVVESAVWALKTAEGEVISEGECEVSEHVLDALVSFEDIGTYYLWYIYDIGDETWVDKIKVRVG